MTDKTSREELIDALASGALDRRAFVTRALGLGVGLTAIGSLLAACDDKDEAPKPEATPEPKGPPPMDQELKIYNWSDYIAEDTVANFENEFNVKVTYDTFESNEELIAKLQAGAAGYDLVCPSGYAVQVLLALKLLDKFDAKMIPNLGNLSGTFRNTAYDPQNEYTVPWQWGITGIAYRKDLVPVAPDSWAVFLDAAHKGKMTMMDDMRDVIGAWLKYRGHSLNSSDPAELAAAKTDAVAAKANLQSFISAPVKGQLVAGDVAIAQLWNGDTAQAAVEQDQIAFVQPKEGASIWTDCMVMPKAAKNRTAAHAFLDYVLRPDVSASIGNYTGYGSPNEKALALLDKAVPFPTKEEMANLEFQRDLAEHTAEWDQIWTEIKAG